MVWSKQVFIVRQLGESKIERGEYLKAKILAAHKLKTADLRLKVQFPNSNINIPLSFYTHASLMTHTHLERDSPPSWVSSQHRFCSKNHNNSLFPPPAFPCGFINLLAQISEQEVTKLYLLWLHLPLLYLAGQK